MFSIRLPRVFLNNLLETSFQFFDTIALLMELGVYFMLYCKFLLLVYMGRNMFNQVAKNESLLAILNSVHWVVLVEYLSGLIIRIIGIFSR